MRGMRASVYEEKGQSQGKNLYPLDAMVDFVTVYGKEDVRITFKNGMEVPTKIE